MWGRSLSTVASNFHLKWKDFETIPVMFFKFPTQDKPVPLSLLFQHLPLLPVWIPLAGINWRQQQKIINLSCKNIKHQKGSQVGHTESITSHINCKACTAISNQCSKTVRTLWLQRSHQTKSCMWLTKMQAHTSMCFYFDNYFQIKPIFFFSFPPFCFLTKP